MYNIIYYGLLNIEVNNNGILNIQVVIVFDCSITIQKFYNTFFYSVKVFQIKMILLM